MRAQRSLRGAGSRRAIVQVAPAEPGGVLDYLLCLKHSWAALGIESHSVQVSKPLAREAPLADRVLAATGRSADSPHTVVLHFSGYGYGQRGICYWLLGELQKLRERLGTQLRLVVVFHELYALGPPWRSAFWVSHVQRDIARRLAHMADVHWTNTDRHASWLRTNAAAGATVHAQPVFSNVGEPTARPRLSERPARAVVFGSGATRQHAFNALQALQPALMQLGVRELIEVGSGAPAGQSFGALRYRHAGRLAPDELSAILLHSQFGLLHYPANCLGKSGVFAAYAAHGCSVVNTHPPLPDGEGLTAGLDYLPLTGLEAWPHDMPAHEARAERLARWYDGHRLADQAQTLLHLAQAS